MQGWGQTGVLLAAFHRAEAHSEGNKDRGDACFLASGCLDDSDGACQILYSLVQAAALESLDSASHTFLCIVKWNRNRV